MRAAEGERIELLPVPTFALHSILVPLTLTALLEYGAGGLAGWTISWTVGVVCVVDQEDGQLGM
jgi:hypothetical protein